MKTEKIPEATIARLSVYSRYLTKLEKEGIVKISSGHIAKGISGNPAQVRKDFAYFGEFGTRGVGYKIVELNNNIKRILGLNKVWDTIIVGSGNLGTALAQYNGFSDRNFNVVSLFDNDVEKIGSNIGDIEIKSIDDLEGYLDNNEVEIAILTVPSSNAQTLANRLIAKGIKGILNFSPTVVNAPGDVQVRNIDLTVNLEILSFNITLNNKEE